MADKILNKRMKGLLARLNPPDNNLLDVLSVIYDFRPVATCALWPKSVRSLAPQVEILDKLAEKSDCTIEKGWIDNIYFFMKKSHKTDVDYFIRKHYSPLESKDAEIAFGLLMNYPKCCIDEHVKNKDRYSVKLLPYAPCSEDCAKPWLSLYNNLSNTIRALYHNQGSANNLNKSPRHF